jgi:hypothetical protein
MSVDVRTRVDGAQAPVDPTTFFTRDLPAAFEAADKLVGRALEALALAPLEITVDGDTWTLRAEGSRCAVLRGAHGGDGVMRLRLDTTGLDDLATDQVSPMGWFSSGTLQLEGRLERLLDWWLVLRGALDQRAPHMGAAPTFVDRAGAPLDLDRTFAVDDADGDLAWFLEQAGFLHIAGVFDEDEMAAVSAEMDRVAPTYTQGDGRSWWARTRQGVDRLVRMQGFDTRSPRTASLVADGRLARLGALPADGHRWGSLDDTGNALEALVKPIGIVEGISDVPWHKDCSLGRHSYDCCSLTVGISVMGADESSGQLRVVPGSHRVLVWPAFLRRDNELPMMDLPTKTGDVTVHLSCTMHMAQPPVTRERRVMYTGFRLPPLAPEAAAASHRRMRAVRETAAVTVSQPPSPVSR